MAWQGNFDVLDDETASLIIRLQRVDLEYPAHDTKGKQREDETFAADLATRLSLEKLTLSGPFRAEDQMVRSVGMAVQARSQHQAAGEHHPKAESSTQDASRKSVHFQKSSRCDICSDDKPQFEVVTAPCGIQYCTNCLSWLFETSMTDGSLYPPRCCRQPIPLSLARPFLRLGLAEDFADKSVELDTKDRTYCHDQSLSLIHI